MNDLNIPDDGQHAVIVVRRTEHANTIAPGSRREACTECGEEVWWAPSSDPTAQMVIDQGKTLHRVCCCCIGMHDVFDVMAARSSGDVELHLRHTWVDGRCTECNRSQADSESEMLAAFREVIGDD